MFIFSVSAKARKAMEGISVGQEVPFIVYINFKDPMGAEKLCQLYLLRAGFGEIEIGKRKTVADHLLKDQRVINADRALKEALEKGYAVQLFEKH